MSGKVSIIDKYGKPMVATPRRVYRGLNGPANTPYDSADVYGEHMAAWRPFLWSPDTELNMYRDRIVSRVRDMVRNDGWAAGGITRILDNAIGANFRPIPKPDYRSLQIASGLKTFDAQWAHEYAVQAQANYRTWANDPGRWCDIERGQSAPQMYYLGFRHKCVDGDTLAAMRWEPSRVGYGRAPYATAVQLIDPDRLSNPMQNFDTKYCRGGVVIDDFGAAVAYQIRQAHQGDWFNAAESLHWIKVPRETAWGRPMMIHDFDRDRAGQHRGGAGVLSPVLQRLKMLIKYDGVELDAAIINAIFAAYIESPFDHSLLSDALGTEVDGGISAYQDGRRQFHDERRILLGSAAIPTLYPGEKINAVAANRPGSNFPVFESAMLRNAASGMGISAQQLSQDWSDVNYSSARSAMLEAWMTMERRRAAYVAGFCHPIYATWLEESHESDDYPLPAGAPDFIEARGAYATARWIGPAKGWVDPVAEREGAWLGMEMGLSNLEDEAAEQGIYWLDNLDQLEIEEAAFKERKLNRPSWMGSSGKSKVGNGGGANQEAAMPSAPKVRKEEAQQ